MRQCRRLQGGCFTSRGFPKRNWPTPFAQHISNAKCLGTQKQGSIVSIIGQKLQEHCKKKGFKRCVPHCGATYELIMAYVDVVMPPVDKIMPLVDDDISPH